jgi:hypothetical protein
VVGIARSEQMTVEGGAALTDAWIDDRSPNARFSMEKRFSAHLPWSRLVE